MRRIRERATPHRYENEQPWWLSYASALDLDPAEVSPQARCESALAPVTGGDHTDGAAFVWEFLAPSAGITQKGKILSSNVATIETSNGWSDAKRLW